MRRTSAGRGGGTGEPVLLSQISGVNSSAREMRGLGSTGTFWEQVKCDRRERSESEALSPCLGCWPRGQLFKFKILVLCEPFLPASLFSGGGGGWVRALFYPCVGKR